MNSYVITMQVMSSFTETLPVKQYRLIPVLFNKTRFRPMGDSIAYTWTSTMPVCQSCLATSVSLHDTRAAATLLIKSTSSKVSYCHDLMDAAYDGDEAMTRKATEAQDSCCHIALTSRKDSAEPEENKGVGQFCTHRLLLN